MGRPRAATNGFVLVPTAAGPKRNTTMTQFVEDADPPRGGVLLSRVPLAPAANEVFGKAELDARIETMSAVHAAVAPAREKIHCWACGAKLPLGTWPALFGWSSRPVPDIPGCVEVYCAGCFAEWGWPDRPTREAS